MVVLKTYWELCLLAEKARRTKGILCAFYIASLS